MIVRWYVVNTFSGAEWAAHRGLLRRGVRSYLPYVLQDARRGRWTQATVRPQFPTYLFAGIDTGAAVTVVCSVIGVRDVVRNGVEAVVVSQRQICDIEKQCHDRLRESIPKRAHIDQWQVGDIVPVPYGPLMGVPVQITAIDKSGRVSASIGSLAVSFDVPSSVRRMAAHGAPSHQNHP